MKQRHYLLSLVLISEEYDDPRDATLGAAAQVSDGYIRCVIKSPNDSRELSDVYPETTSIRSICESVITRRWYRPNTMTGLKRPHETDQIPWYTDSIPALTTSGPSNYEDAGALRINMHEPVIVFFSKVRNHDKLSADLVSTGRSSMPLASSHKAQLAHVDPDLSISAHSPKVRHNTVLSAELGAFKADQLSPGHEAPNFPCIHINDSLAISFHRTARIPDDGGSYPAPKSLGALPIFSVARLNEKLPRDAVEKGGVVMPLYGECAS